MIIAILQPSFLPWLGYLEQMAVADLFVYLDDVKYTSQDWRNRNRILNRKGDAEYITVPVRAGAEHQLIKDVEIGQDLKWRRKMCAKLQESYRTAKFGDTYLPSILEILQRNHKHLVDLNYDLMEFLRASFHISTPTVLSSDIPNLSSDKNQRLIDICTFHNADVLYDGASAADFVDLERFKRAGIAVTFQNYLPEAYEQERDGFVGYLSAIDVLLRQGPVARQILDASPLPPQLSSQESG